MGKKKFIGLSILLLVLLLGLSTTCYADDQRTWKKEYLQNILYNYFTTYSNYTETQKTNYINTANTWFESILTILNENKHIMITFESSFPSAMYLHYSNGNSKVYNYGSNKLGVQNHNDWKTEKYSWWANDVYKTNGIGNTYSYNTNYYVMDVDVYTDSTYFLILIPANTIKPNATILTSPYTPATFEFSPNLDYLTAVTIQGNTSTIPSYLFIPSSNYYYTIGSFKDFDLLDGIIQTTYYYNTLNRDFEVLNESEVNINSFNVEDNELLFEIDKRTKTADTLTTYNFISNEPDDWEQQAVTIYWGGVNTKVVNGVVMVDDTFSGDYDNAYTNDLNHEETINAINDIKDTITDDSQVDSILGNFGSGDIAGTMGYTEHSLPNVPDERNPSLLLMNLINDFCDILIDDDDPYWDYSMHGEIPTRIYASDFTTENTPLKTFISLSMIFGSMFLIYIQFKHIIELINEGNAPKVLHDIDADMYFYKM